MINIDRYYRSVKLQFTPILLNNLTNSSTENTIDLLTINLFFLIPCVMNLYMIYYISDIPLTVIFKFPSHNIDHIIFL